MLPLAMALFGLLASLPATAQVCAPPASLVTGPTSGVVNTYYVPGNASLPVGATQLNVGATSGYDQTPPAIGDLLLVIQMQDATFNTSNSSSYGSGSGSGQGSTSVRSSGLHEFVRVTAASGSNITYTPPLQNAYNNASATVSTPQQRYQVIRVRQYTSLTAGGISAPQWNGQTGGVIAVDVRDTLTLGSGTVEGQSAAFFAAGKGFRGGAGRNLTTSGGVQTDWATTDNFHGGKGEGMAGTPRYYADLTSGWGFQSSNPPAITVVDLGNNNLGYPGGSSARGAPGNGGGGGTDGSDSAGSGNNQYNAGGGGGGNYGPGGIGGRPWNYPLVDSGGRGGEGYSGTLAFNRAVLGGGGGAGGTNNNTSDNRTYTNQAMSCTLGGGLCSSGAPGGGLVVIRARNITGGGIIDVRGAHAYNVDNDAGGGAGGGGSVILHTQNGGNATIYAQGGDGGNAFANSTGAANRHGPGGGGGGGFVAYSPNSMAVSATVNGGIPGISSSGDNYDATGYNGGITTFQSPNTPGVPPAAQCEPSLSLTKTDGVSSLSSPGTTTYTLTVLNSGLGASSGTVAVADKLPAGLSVVPGPLTLSGPNAASWSCSATNTTDILCSSTSSISGHGGSSTFAIPVAVSAGDGSSLVNKAQVSGGNDPNKTTPADPVAAAASCTANNTPAGCALDTDTVSAPNLTLTKTDNTTSVVRGGTSTYSLVASNNGGTVTTGTITVVDVLPTGLSFSSTSFSVNGFACSASASTLTCTRSTALNANVSATITVPVLVAADAPSSVTNLARIGGGGDPSPNKPTPTAASVAACTAPVAPDTISSDPNNGCAADTNEVRYVNLSLSKDDGAPYMSRNGTVDYAFVVLNNGTAPTSGVLNFRDVLPSPMNFPNPLIISGANAGDWSFTRVSNTEVSGSSTVSIPAGGSSTFTLQVGVGSASTGVQLTNKARIGGGGDVSPGMVTSPTSTDVTDCTTDGSPTGCAIDMNTVQDAPKIRLTKSHPNPQARNPGDIFDFTLTVSNTGGSNAAVGSVQVIDVIPAGLTIQSVTPAAGLTCAFSGQIVNCRNATSVTNTSGNNNPYRLNANTSRTIAVKVQVDATATNDLLNLAKAAGSGDPQNSAPRTTSTTNLDIVRACVGTDAPNLGCATDPVPLNADLQISKLQRTGTGTFTTTLATAVPTNGTVQFQINVTNSGPSRVTATAVSDNVPTNFTGVTWTCATLSGGASCGAVTSGSGNAISLTAGLMPSGSSIRITVNAIATYATDMDGVTNTAVVTAPSGIVDGTPTNNISSVNTRVGSVNLSITKDNGVSTVMAGSTTTYTIVVRNTGDYPADGARLQDPLVPGLSCTTPPSCVASGAATSCPPGLTVSQLQNATAPTGVMIPTLGPGGSLTLSYTCSVTATGQ